MRVLDAKTRRAQSLSVSMLAAVFLFSPTLHAQTLSRRASLGVDVGPVSPDAATTLSLPSSTGALVVAVHPGSAAELAGVEQWDVILRVDGVPIADDQALNALLAQQTVGQSVSLSLWRWGSEASASVIIEALALEQHSDYDTEYTELSLPGDQRRVIITRPRPAESAAPELLPAVYLIQGLTCASIDLPFSPDHPYRAIIDHLTLRGYITLRVDKSGMGDSEGSPCSEIDFETEVDDFRRGLAFLRTVEGVNPNQIFIFGHSMGGIIGPILAAETPVRGLIVYGTGAQTWFEYEIENTRRQLELGGYDSLMTEAWIRLQIEELALFFVNQMSPTEVIGVNPELARYFDDETHLSGRYYTYFQQLNAWDLPQAWAEVTSHVLAIHGEADYVSSAQDHQRIVNHVNQSHPGLATFLELPQSDHSFFWATSELGAYETLNSGSPMTFNPAIVDEVDDWITGVLNEP